MFTKYQDPNLQEFHIKIIFSSFSTHSLLNTILSEIVYVCVWLILLGSRANMLVNVPCRSSRQYLLEHSVQWRCISSAALSRWWCLGRRKDQVRHDVYCFSVGHSVLHNWFSKICAVDQQIWNVVSAHCEFIAFTAPCERWHSHTDKFMLTRMPNFQARAPS